MKTFKETFDENIWDRTKAKAAGAVAGAKGWASQTARNVMGKDPADAGQAGAAAKLQAQATSLAQGGAKKIEKLVNDFENDIVLLTGFKGSKKDPNFEQNKEQAVLAFYKENPEIKKLMDNIIANWEVLYDGEVQLPQQEPEQTTTEPAVQQQTPETEPDGQQTLGIQTGSLFRISYNK